ncbi:MAG: DUF4906 domain-containing protein [Odoribacter sp.]|nr:DUF4906 domain-containing protein [Odoribacter sp.]
MKAKYIFTGILFLIIHFLSSCLDEEVVGPEKPEEREVNITLLIPRTYAAAAGSGLTEKEERLISDFTILLFSINSAGNQECVGFIDNLAPTPVPGTDSAQYIVRTQIPTGIYHMAFLANVSGKLSATTTVGSLRSDIEKNLVHNMQFKWDITTHTGFPMYGATKGEVMITGTTVIAENIAMLRMVSRINIAVDTNLQNKIKINTIRLQNPSGRGLVIPDATKLDTNATTGYVRAVLPSLPLNALGNADPQLLTSPFIYTSVDIENQAFCLNTIYALEGFEPQGRPINSYAYLEIVAQYENRAEKTYRVDFWQEDASGNKTPLPLLRNHTYDITIVGMDEFEEELEVRVNVWDDGNMSDIKIEGKYHLKVNKATWDFDREVRDTNSFNNHLEITTNHEDGWQITRITEPNNGPEIDMDTGWIRIAQNDRSGPQGTKTIRLLLEKNDTPSPRSADIHLQVGRLIDFIVKVNQSTETVLELVVEDLDGNPISELFFMNIMVGRKLIHQKI